METMYRIDKNDLLTEPDEVADMLGYGEKERAALRNVSAKYKMCISKYYADLIGQAGEPVRKQCIPDSRELLEEPCFVEDPLQEDGFSPVPYLVYKYPDRAAFMASSCCFMYCRYCTRKNTAINRRQPNEEEFRAVLAFLRRTPAIRDVLITGGDPLTLSDEQLEHFVKGIREIGSVETIRIGTRAIVTYPDRITEKLADMLARYHPVWINTQFNHPTELTEQATRACSILLSRGIPLGNQTVLMSGINDDIVTMEKLVTGLIKIRVRPYYLYQLDDVQGTQHFFVPYIKGIEIVEELRRRVSGYAVPRFVIDVQGENGGKIVVEKNHIIAEEDGCMRLTGRKPDTEVTYHYHGGENFEKKTT